MKKNLFVIAMVVLLAIFAISCENETVKIVGVETKEALLAAVGDGTKAIYLKNDIAVNDYIDINKGQTLTIDLNGKTIDLGNGSISINYQGTGEGGSLSVVGKGTIKSVGDKTFDITGSASLEKDTMSYLSIGKDVTVEGPINVYNADGASASYGVKVEIYGTIKGKQPLYVNGTIKNTEKAPMIHIHENAKIEDLGDGGIYIAGYAKVIVDKANITSNGNALVLCAGEAEINGATIVGGTEYGTSPSVGGSITSELSSAIYIKQHTTNLPVKVVVNSGKFSGYIPFYQTKGQNSSPAPDKVALEIKGGEFTCTSTTADKVAVKSADKTGFITGGLFSEKPADAYIAEGYKAVEAGTGWEVAKKSAE